MLESKERNFGRNQQKLTQQNLVSRCPTSWWIVLDCVLISVILQRLQGWILHMVKIGLITIFRFIRVRSHGQFGLASWQLQTTLKKVHSDGHISHLIPSHSKNRFSDHTQKKPEKAWRFPMKQIQVSILGFWTGLMQGILYPVVMYICAHMVIFDSNKPRDRCYHLDFCFQAHPALNAPPWGMSGCSFSQLSTQIS